MANRIVEHGLKNNLVNELKNNEVIKPEVFFNKETRFDFLLEKKGTGPIPVGNPYPSASPDSKRKGLSIKSDPQISKHEADKGILIPSSKTFSKLAKGTLFPRHIPFKSQDAAMIGGFFPNSEIHFNSDFDIHIFPYLYKTLF